jgi:hypothetical protein
MTWIVSDKNSGGNMRRIIVTFLLLSFMLLLVAYPAVAQTYSYVLPKETVDAYWNSDGTLTLDYTYIFTNDPSGPTIEFIDLGLPNNNYSISNITAAINGNPVTDISSSGFQGSGCCGVAIGLGQYSVPPGSSGTFQAHISNITGVLYTDENDSSYASADFAPNYFGGDIHGNTDITVTYHFPPGVKTDEPRWHAAPDGFPDTPVTAMDSEGRIIYEWQNQKANGYTSYLFGASFPKSYVPAGSIESQPPPSTSGASGLGSFISSALLPILCIGGFIAIVISGLSSSQKRKLQYLPPKISIEGHGIKRGLTAVEAAILLEEPLDKIMTMILFSSIKKNAAEVVTRDPLDVKVTDPLPDDIQAYEKDFLEAFKTKDAVQRRTALRDMVINLVKSVAEKMKGFSRQETVAYYKDITKRAWEQVEAAGTPEVKSAKYEEVMEWTMLDKNYGDRTQDVFRNMPVFIPTWWGHYDPTFGRVSTPSSGAPFSTGGSRGVPGADFAASMAAGVQTFSSKAVGNISEFTSSIARTTNPPPPPSTSNYRSSGGSGHSCVCACACACAGCACACAGGGR